MLLVFSATTVNGTLNVLKACARNKSIKRVVLTSSVAALTSGRNPPFKNGDSVAEPEKEWSDVKRSEPYRKFYTVPHSTVLSVISCITQQLYMLLPRCRAIEDVSRKSCMGLC